MVICYRWEVAGRDAYFQANESQNLLTIHRVKPGKRRAYPRVEGEVLKDAAGFSMRSPGECEKKWEFSCLPPPVW
jgi:hypothetical protein